MSSNVSPQTPPAAVVFAPFVPSAPSIPPAWAADVVSSNVVGYNKVDLNRGYNMLAVQFNEVGGGAQSIQDIFTGNLPDMAVDGEGFPIWNAKIQTWNGAGYDIYYWTGSVGGELFDDSSYNNVWVAGEYGEDGVAHASTPIGDGVFLWTSSTGVTVLQAGEVATNATKTVSISPGYNLICNPFPEAINIQNVSISNLPDMGVDSEGFPV